MSLFYAFTMRVGGRIKEIDGFVTEAEADAFGIKVSGFREFDDSADFYAQYDPPIVLVVEAESIDILETGKYKRPVAIYQRGEKWMCVPPVSR